VRREIDGDLISAFASDNLKRVYRHEDKSMPVEDGMVFEILEDAKYFLHIEHRGLEIWEAECDDVKDVFRIAIYGGTQIMPADLPRLHDAIINKSLDSYFNPDNFTSPPKGTKLATNILLIRRIYAYDDSV